MLIVCIVVTVIRIRVVKKREGDNPYYDLIVFSSGVGLCLAVFGFVYIDDPGVEYLMVSLTIFLLVTIIIFVVFAKKVISVINNRILTGRLKFCSCRKTGWNTEMHGNDGRTDMQMEGQRLVDYRVKPLRIN